ncbi:MAG: hypothetical protein V7645_967 [Actinomycetota bacterium]|jgi:hypothetical protein
MKLRLTGTLVLVLGVAALASASAYAGNGNGSGNGNGKNEPATAAPAAADAPGQLKKDDIPAAPAPAALENVAAQDAGAAQTGVKPSNDTAHDTRAAASSDETKEYGNGKTAGQIAIGNGAAPSTVLHGPGNSQPHKASPCSGGHEVDVHALKGKRGRTCGTQPPSPPAPRPNPTPDPGKPGDPGHGPNGSNNPPAATSSPADPSTPGMAKPVVSSRRGRVESASGVLSATGAIGGGTLPFTGFPLGIVVMIAVALIAVGMTMRRRGRTPAA